MGARRIGRDIHVLAQVVNGDEPDRGDGGRRPRAAVLTRLHGREGVRADEVARSRTLAWDVYKWMYVY